MNAQVHKKKLHGRHPGPHFGRQLRHLFIGIKSGNYLLLSSTSIIFSIIQSCRNLRRSKRNSDQRKLFEIKFAQSESVLNAQQQRLLRGNNCQFDCISIAKKHSFPIAETLSMQTKYF